MFDVYELRNAGNLLLENLGLGLRELRERSEVVWQHVEMHTNVDPTSGGRP